MMARVPVGATGEADDGGCVGTRRTNIEIDEGLAAEVMARYGTRTLRETVDLALRTLVGERRSTEDVLALRGSGWEGDLGRLRAGWSRTEGAAHDDAEDAGA